MPMPGKFTADDFVDAAIRLILEGGPGAATASAVAQVVGAPSGSVYHRFPTRRDLLAAAWLTPVRRFQEDFLPLLAADGDPVAIGIAAASHVLRWSADHHEAAALLARYSRSDFVSADCSAAVLTEADALDRRAAEALDRFLARFPAADRDRVLLAVIDAPLALVRRSFAAGGPDDDAVELAADVARRLLASGSARATSPGRRSSSQRTSRRPG
ncbi:TetR/AcrR family transcriptional regulator [Mycolicibacter terrae]|uniref:TetR family transcriptional regulator n=2 Tax=Mycolicibacter TaxID=1073531 RepID=A0A1A2NZS9_MYCSD|nr:MULTISPECIES: TetR/AcrR family transcriptional regulator [Mycolicibacter]OBH20581.1 TetR family transcriptional regulator [Mycolicibacter sinensis]OBI26392.1 TetR family transcriptional regulator [Mycolicibacter sinensis]RRR44603.1 TetR/AcrR family transcriptional regulator [Mycolicibacter terrae]